MYGGNWNNWSYPMYPNNPMPPRQEVIRVHGREGAVAFAMGPNSSVMLMDETQPVVWLKTTDSASYPTLNGYSLIPLEETPEIKEKDVITELVERISDIERRLDAKQSDAQSVRNKQYSPGSSRSNQRNDSDS